MDSEPADVERYEPPSTRLFRVVLRRVVPFGVGFGIGAMLYPPIRDAIATPPLVADVLAMVLLVPVLLLIGGGLTLYMDWVLER